jgi:hypothetical protein
MLNGAFTIKHPFHMLTYSLPTKYTGSSITASSQTDAERTSGGVNSRGYLAPVFPRACHNLQSWGQQFQLNKVMSLLDSVLSHLPLIGFRKWECVVAEHNQKFPDKD